MPETGPLIRAVARRRTSPRTERQRSTSSRRRRLPAPQPLLVRVLRWVGGACTTARRRSTAAGGMTASLDHRDRDAIAMLHLQPVILAVARYSRLPRYLIGARLVGAGVFGAGVFGAGDAGAAGDAAGCPTVTTWNVGKRCGLN